MGEQSNQAERITADKFCGQCGQKNFRPNRSLKELFVEFVEDWLGYDSKIYKTAAKLAKPAALSLDYFRNSHHKNHYITPIRLYLLLSIIFFLMTNFGGLNVTELDLNGLNQPKTAEEKQQVQAELDKAIAETDSEVAKQVLTDVKQEVDNDGIEINDGSTFRFSLTGDSQFNGKDGCTTDPKEIINIWPNWLDTRLDSSMETLCERFDSIKFLPEDQQTKAKAEFGLSIFQNFIEVIPQVFFMSLPLLALLLSIFYFLSKRIYVEHLVLLMHSHSFLFAIILIYLGWFKLTSAFPVLEPFPMELIFSVLGIVYLYLSQKWFYKRGWWATLWRFCFFAFLYFFVLIFIATLSMLVGVMSI